LIFGVIRSMPDEHRTKIQNTVQACYPNDFKIPELGTVMPKVNHFCIWNQYTETVRVFWAFPVFTNSNPTKGMGAPEEVHPNDLVRSTQQGSFIPRPRIPFLSKAITEDGGQLYSQLSTGLQDVFTWLSGQVI